MPPKGKANPKAGEQKPKTDLLVDSPSRWQSWWVRFRLSVFMILGFGAVVYIGHWALVALVFSLQVFGFRELAHIRDTVFFDSKKKNPSPYSSGYFDVLIFSTVQYFFYGMVIFNHFGDYFRANSTPEILRLLAQYHTLVCFSLVALLIVTFVLSLEANKYLQQFQYITWTIMTMIAVIPSNFHIVNILNGIIWFLLPVALVICNDISAYIWGFFIGRHSLIQLSPKKTWEGFIGAFFATVVFGFLFSYVTYFDLFVCPKQDLFSLGTGACVRNPIFQERSYPIPVILGSLGEIVGLNWRFITIAPFHFVGVFFGIFASTIAPFGGFLASGLKRAYGIKDFGDLIPGHGGIVDRMDCQVIMATFSFIFYLNFVVQNVNVSAVVDSITSLPLSQQLDVLYKLQQVLAPVNV